MLFRLLLQTVDMFSAENTGLWATTRKTPKGVINLRALNDERRLKASWIRLNVITAQDEWLQALYPVCG